MIQPRLAWELARKDLLLFLADRRGALLCFAVPVLLAGAFGAIFHRPDETSLRPVVHVVLGGDDDFSRRVVEALCAHDRLKADTCDRDTARRRLAGEASGVVIVLPAELARLAWLGLDTSEPRSGGRGSCRAGYRQARREPRPPGSTAEPPRIELWHHPQSAVESRLVEGVLTEVLLREAARSMLAKVRPALECKRPFTVERTAVGAGGALSVNAYGHSFCGMTLQYLLFWGVDSGLLLLRERRQGLWRRLRAAPVGRLDLLAGKALATALVALAQIAVTFGVGWALFGVRVTGSVAGFVLMALAAALLSAATGLLVAALGGNEGRARSVAILVILTLSLLGGLWLPSFLLPAWARKLALALPTTWAARGLEGVTWQGMALADAWPCAAALAGFSLAFLAVAWWRLVRACPQ
jgi:ABC-2 type transport system permease protein